MDLIVTILTIFLVIAVGTIVFLLNAKQKTDSSFITDNLEQRIASSIESVYEKREENFKKNFKRKP